MIGIRLAFGHRQKFSGVGLHSPREHNQLNNIYPALAAFNTRHK